MFWGSNLNALWRVRLGVLFAGNERSGCRRPSKPRRCNERRSAQCFTSGNCNSSPRTVPSPPRRDAARSASPAGTSTNRQASRGAAKRGSARSASPAGTTTHRKEQFRVRLGLRRAAYISWPAQLCSISWCCHLTQLSVHLKKRICSQSVK